MTEKKVYKKHYCPYCDSPVTTYYTCCPACSNPLVWPDEYNPPEINGGLLVNEAIRNANRRTFHRGDSSGWSHYYDGFISGGKWVLNFFKEQG